MVLPEVTEDVLPPGQRDPLWRMDRIVDLTCDGWPEIIPIDEGGAIFWNTGGDQFVYPIIPPAYGDGGGTRLVVGDFDGDDRSDSMHTLQ